MKNNPVHPAAAPASGGEGKTERGRGSVLSGQNDIPVAFPQSPSKEKHMNTLKTLLGILLVCETFVIYGLFSFWIYVVARSCSA